MLKTVKDKSNSILELWQSNRIIDSPCVPLYNQIANELLEKQWSLYNEYNDDLRIVWVQDSKRQIFGGIAYTIDEHRTGWIVLSFTDPKYRGHGINQLCHEAYETDCKNLGCIRVASHVHLDNKSRLTSAEKVGMLPKFFVIGKKI
jgi:RimJ/RimL family protein N-acetyltransferase